LPASSNRQEPPGPFQKYHAGPGAHRGDALWLSKILKSNFLDVGGDKHRLSFGKLAASWVSVVKFRFIGVYLPTSLRDYARESVPAGNFFGAQ
jgi:hypothetical protein